MQRKHVFILVALVLSVGLTALPAMAQSAGSGGSDMRFGVGGSITRINDGLLGKTAFMPTAVLDFGNADVEFGFNLRAGENETQFMLQVGGAYYPFAFDHGDMGFGIQFNLETDAVTVNNNGQSAIMFGLYTEYKVSATEALDIGLKVFPFQLFHTENYSRIGLFSPGFSTVIFF